MRSRSLRGDRVGKEPLPWTVRYTQLQISEPEGVQRNMRKSAVRSVRLMVVALVMCLAGGVAMAQQEPQYGGTLTIAQRVSPRTLHSIIDPGLPGIAILNLTEEGLLGMSNSGEVVPVLAEAMPTVIDPLTYEFTLREGILFHSGDPLTAEDVVFTYERLYLPDSIASFRAAYQEHIVNVEAIDDRTIRFTLHKPWPIFLSFAASNHTKVVNRRMVEEAGDQYGISVWDGTGPFRIVNWVSGDHVSLERNPHYWQEGRPYLDGIIFRTIPEAATQMANFQTGLVDIVLDPDMSQIPVYANLPGAAIHSASSAAETLLVFRTSIAPMDDARVRRAVSLAIDREEILETVLRGYGSAGGPIFPPHHWAHSADFHVEYDPEAAVQLLAEAGYGEGNPLEFTLVVVNESIYSDQAILVQRQLADIGVTVNVLPLEFTAVAGMATGSPHDQWLGDAAMFRITPLRGTAFEFAHFQYHSQGSLNTSGYVSSRVDELLSLAATFSDYDERERAEALPLYHEANAIIVDEAPQLLLNFADTVNIVQSRVGGFEASATNTALFTDVWIGR